MTKIKFRKIAHKINLKDLNQIRLILKKENQTSILANLSKLNIYNYFKEVVRSRDFELFVISNQNIIGYALIVKKPKYLIGNFDRFKFQFFFDLLINFKFMSIINIFISKIGLDNLLIKKIKKKILSNSINLNLLAIQKNHQSKGLGKKFLTYIINNTQFESTHISCETDNFRSNKFYVEKLLFKNIGKKIRFPYLMKVLIKKI